jgi:hypothetical protein
VYSSDIVFASFAETAAPLSLVRALLAASKSALHETSDCRVSTSTV